MNLRFAAVVIVVLFVGAPTLESIGARAQSACSRACAAAESPSDPEVIRGLIHEGNNLCNCNCPGANGGGVLHVAATNGCVLCINLLTDNPGNCTCDYVDFARNTPLHNAVIACNIPTTRNTIDAGCNVNAVNYAGNTPLCIASRNTREVCIGVVVNLFEAGAQSCRTCRDGQTICERCAPEITCNALRERGACNC